MIQAIGCLVRRPGKPVELYCEAPGCAGRIVDGRLDCAACRYAQILRSDPLPARPPEPFEGPRRAGWLIRLAGFLRRGPRRA